MVTVVLGIIQMSPYIYMGKLLFVSSTPSLLQFVVVDLLTDGKGGCNNHHEHTWIQPPLRPLSQYWFLADLVVERMMTLNIF